MNKNKTKQRLMAMMLSVIMVVGMTPVSALDETDRLPIGASGEITAFEGLETDVATLSVPFGTSKADLKLPDALTATVRLATLEEKPVIDSGEVDWEQYSADTVSDSVIDVYKTDNIETGGSSEGAEIVSPLDSGKTRDNFEAEPEVNDGDSAGEITILLPVTWASSPEYHGETAGTYIFTPELPKGLALASGVEAPAITVTVTEDASPVLVVREMFTVFSTGSGETQVLGLGTEEYPLRIETAAQLADFAWCLNNSTLPTTLPEQPHLLLVNDIDLSAYGAGYDSGKGWMPIGTDSKPFRGSFDGGGKIITGLYIERHSTAYVGLFGYLRGGVVQDLALQDVSISGKNFVGGVAGYVYYGGRVQNCAVSGNIQGENHVGGVTGVVASGIVQNCAVAGRINCSTIGAGGVVGGVSGGTVENCVVTGNISGSNTVGGVAGSVSNNSTLENCVVTGSISGGIVGGIAGEVTSSGTVQGCAVLSSIVDPRTNIFFGRVISSYSSPTLSGNYAWSGMTVKNSTVSDTNADSINGADVNFSAIQTLWTTGPLNTWDSDLWTLAEGKLPVLTGLPGQNDALPPYIAGLEGAGTSESDPYRIYTADDLKWLADQVNGVTGFAYGKFFRLENDIDLSAYGKDYDGGKGWTPIGCAGQFENAVFNGNGKTITGLYINRSNESNIGLFGSVMHGTIQNLFLEDITLRSDTNLLECKIGGLAGSAGGGSSISGCVATGSVSGEGAVKCFIGGLVGILEQGSTANNCTFYGTVSAKAEVNSEHPTSPPTAFAGGIAGQVYNGAAVTNCLSIATVDGAGSSAYMGGIAGQVDAGAKIAQSAALGARVSSNHNAGRIVIIGSGASSDPMNQNYAWSGITVNSETVSGSANGNHGGDIDAAALQTLWTTGPLNTWDSHLWKLSEGKLPILKTLSGQSDTLPAYIAGLEGSGTSESDPYRIYTTEDLKWLTDQVNGGNGFSGKYFRLENDIDLSAYGSGYDGGKGWMPIGKTYENPFKGSFNGNGKAVTGLYINRSDMDNVGLFGVVNMGAVENLILCSVSINTVNKDCVGGIAGRIIESKVRHCAVSGSIKGNLYVGGIAGDAVANTTTVENCVSAANVEGFSSVGGIVGTAGNSVMLNGCLSTGNVSGISAVGGMVGGVLNSCSIQNCVSTGSISGNFIGGIVGITTGSTNTLQNCAALNPSISATGSIFGRVAGNPASVDLTGNYAFSGMKVNGNTVSSGTLDNKDGANANTALLLRTLFWRDTLDFNEAIWNIAEGRLPYLMAFPEYAPNLELAAYTFPASDSSDITLATYSTLLIKSAAAQTVTLTATGTFKDTAWPDLVWETSAGDLTPAADTYSASLTVPAGFTGSITVTAKPVRFPALPGKSVTVTVNGDLEGTVNAIGTFRYGYTLTVSPSITSTSSGTLFYQWMRGSEPIIGADDTTYKLTEDDIGEIVSVCVTAQNYADKIQSVGQTVLWAENTKIPVVPQLESKTQISIALKTVVGYEYAILTAGSDVALLGLTDAFQSDNLFTGLTADTSYDLYQRIAGTATTEPSLVSEKLTVTTDQASTYTATVNPTSKTFTAATVGYSAQTAQQFTIQNTGSGTITGLNVSLTEGGKFEISTALSNPSIVSGNTATMSVRPKTGLSTGTYTDTLYISGDNGICLTVSLSFTVNNSSGGSPGSGGGSGNSGSDTSPVTITPEKTPGQPITATTPVTATAGENGASSATISDKTITDAIAKAQANAKVQGKAANGISVGLDVTLPKGATSLTASLARNSLNSLVSAGVMSLEITGSPVTVSFDKKALAEIHKQSSGDVTIAIKPVKNLSTATKKLIGTRPVYDISVSYVKDGKTVVVSTFNGGIATISVPYKPGRNETTAYLYGVYVDAKGKATHIEGSTYDANVGAVLIPTRHLWVHGVGYTAPSAKFTDISTHWGKESIEYVVGRGLLSGTSETTFAPDTAMTRGMLMTALGRLADVDTKLYTANTFTDVKADSVFRPYIEWAHSKGIVQGIGNQQFAPDRPIIREEIAVIFTNYAKATGYKLPVTRETSTYADASSIGSVYKTAVTAMHQAGIMAGNSGNKFNPKASATRAEVSAILHRYIKLTIDPDTAQGWALNDAGQWFYYKEGKALTGTQTIDGTKYFFNTDGTLKTDWVKDANSWRYYSGNRMLVGWQNIGSDTAKQTYYFDTYGNMVSGKWLQVDGKWYYFNADGSLSKNPKIDGYEVDENGVRKTK